jgi:transposase
VPDGLRLSCVLGGRAYAKQIERETGVTYKTAWRMFKQIRSMLEEGHDPLVGKGKAVEIDETYYGGRRKRGTGSTRCAAIKPKCPSSEH